MFRPAALRVVVAATTTTIACGHQELGTRNFCEPPVQNAIKSYCFAAIAEIYESQRGESALHLAAAGCSDDNIDAIHFLLECGAALEALTVRSTLA